MPLRPRLTGVAALGTVLLATLVAGCGDSPAAPTARPDMDGDGVPASSDTYPTVPGPARSNGCPDEVIGVTIQYQRIQLQQPHRSMPEVQLIVTGVFATMTPSGPDWWEIPGYGLRLGFEHEIAVFDEAAGTMPDSISGFVYKNIYVNGVPVRRFKQKTGSFVTITYALVTVVDREGHFY